MYYDLLIYPEFDKQNMEFIQSFRKKYDPYADFWDPHITLVFPIPDNEIKKEELVPYLENQNFKDLKITINSYEKSWDHWMFLLISKGNKQIIKVHDVLYKGILQKFLRKDIEFIPHIAIGLFAEKEYDVRNPKKISYDKQKYKKALEELREFNLTQEFVVSELVLEKRNDDLSKVLWKKIIKLK